MGGGVCLDLELWVYLWPNGGILEWGNPRGLWADSRKFVLQLYLSAFFLFLSFSPVTEVSSQKLGYCWRAKGSVQLQLSWSGWLLLTTLTSTFAREVAAATASAATPLALWPSLRYSPATFGCADGWLSRVYWCAVQSTLLGYGCPISCKSKEVEKRNDSCHMMLWF